MTLTAGWPQFTQPALHLLKWDCVFYPLLDCEDRTLGNVDGETVGILLPPYTKDIQKFLLM